MAAVVALMAVVTLAFGWWDRHDPPSRRAVSPSTVVTAETESRQPLAVFHVFVGCGGSPADVWRDGAHTDMPVTVFDHRDIALQVFDTPGSWVSVTVRLDRSGELVVVNGPAAFQQGSLSVGAGQTPICR